MSVLWFTLVIGALVLLQMQLFFFTGLRNVVYRRYFSRTAVYEGERAEMVEVLENRKILPIPWLRVESRISPFLRFRRQEDLDIRHEQFHKSVFYMRPFKRITRRHEILCVHRGYFHLKQTSITTGDLFGLFNRFKEIPGEAALYVYPKIPEQSELPMASLKWQGEIIRRRWIMPDPILINGIRAYRSGDAYKDIHWGATAKTGELQVKVHDYTVSPRAILLVNTQVTEMLWGQMELEDQERIEEGIRYAAYLATWSVSNGLEIGFFSNGRLAEEEGVVRILPACSSPHLEAILQAMAKLEIVRERNFHTLLDDLCEAQITGMDLVILSCYWSDALESRSERHRRLGNSVTYVPIPEIRRPKEDRSA